VVIENDPITTGNVKKYLDQARVVFSITIPPNGILRWKEYGSEPTRTPPKGKGAVVYRFTGKEKKRAGGHKDGENEVTVVRESMRNKYEKEDRLW